MQVVGWHGQAELARVWNATLEFRSRNSRPSLRLINIFRLCTVRGMGRARMRRDQVAWGVAALLAAIALVRVATAQAADPGVAPSEEAQREAFDQIANQESELRVHAAKEFPGDPWSQDDEFHHGEAGRARWYSDRRGVSLAHVLRALDDGLHGRWPKPRGARLVTGVQPCRPRLDY